VEWEEWDNPEFVEPIAAPSLRALHWPGVDRANMQVSECGRGWLRRAGVKVTNRDSGRPNPSDTLGRAQQRLRTMCPRIRLTGQNEPGAVAAAAASEVIFLPRCALGESLGGAARWRRRRGALEADDFWGSEASAESDGEREAREAARRAHVAGQRGTERERGGGDASSSSALRRERRSMYRH
jgi:hypothetical protein